MRPLYALVMPVVLAVFIAGCGGQTDDGSTGSAQSRAPLIVYASHNAAETVAILERYRMQTGQPFQLLTDEMAERETRLGNENLMPDADLFIGSSIAELWAVGEAGALRPGLSPALAAMVSPALRDDESRWAALSRRGRVVAYNKDLVTAERIAGVQSYDTLGDDSWQGSLCVSSSGVPGNRALIAFLIGRHGVRDAEIIVRKWRANLAMTVFANDGTLLNAIADGRCQTGLVDSNVLAAFIDASPGTPVRAHWFDAPSNVLADISGAGVTRHASNPEAAVELFEWLLSADANSHFAASRFEFPVNPAAAGEAATAQWSSLMPEPASLTELGFLLEEADRLIERARYP